MLKAAALLWMACLPASAQSPVAGQFDYYVLDLSWEPVFCAAHAAVPECRSETPDRYDASHPVLHGLWPSLDNDPEHAYGYCGVDAAAREPDKPRSWCSLPAPDLSDATRSRLAALMPGAQSCLERHEWLRHGTCSGLSADDYFSLEESLAAQAAATNLGRYLADHAGQTVALSDLQALEASDFPLASGAVVLRCAPARAAEALSEIVFRLKAPLWPGASLASSLAPPPVAEADRCPPSVLIVKE